MTYRPNQSVLWIAASLIGFAAACSSSPVSSEQTQDSPLASSNPSDPAAPTPLGTQLRDEALAQDLALEATECTTWQTYRASSPEPAELPNMPSRFENGCIVGTDLGDRASIYVLPKGTSLERVFDEAALTSAPQQDGVPFLDDVVEGSAGVASEWIASGDVMIFSHADFRACATSVGYVGDSIAYCAFGSPHRAYAVWPSTDNDPTMTCFGVNCLATYGDVSEAELIALWEPWWVPTPNPEVNAVRSQYETIDLNTLSPELQKANFPPNVESLLRQELGRTTLEEGEQPTVIAPVEYTGPEYSFLNVITVTNEGLADDSVGGFRYRFEFDGYDGNTMMLVWAGSQQFCRRTQEWTRQICP
ncbi:MAG: hypothetical protein AAFX01_05985 [Cyanobacteria bacterium J06638_28]